jgi:PAS domain S-box-containing protein
MQQVKKKVQEDPLTPAVLKTVLLYAVFALLWILASDALVGLILIDPAQITIVSTLKGWAFVAVTSLLLFIQLRRLARRLSRSEAEQPGNDPDFAPIGTMRPGSGPEKDKLHGWLAGESVKQLILVFSLLTIVVVGAGLSGIVYSARQEKEKEITRLQTIADLKADQVSNWLAERNADAELIRGNVLFSDLSERWRRTGDKATRAMLLQRMESYRKTTVYHAVVLLDRRGEIVLSIGDESPRATPQLRATAIKAVAEGRVLHTNLYRTENPRQAWTHLDFVAPLPADQGRPGMAVALLVDPKQFLYRNLQSWPIPSASAETLLFRSDNGQTLFLNELRHRRVPMPGESISPKEEYSISMQVIQDRAKPGSTVEGVDYRQMPVLGAVRTIAGTDWFLVAKLDKSELYAATKWDAVWIVLVALLAEFIGAVVLFLIHQRRELQVSELQRLQQEEKLRALQLLDAITENATDAIYAKDRTGHYLLFNREASRKTNKTREEALGKDARALFPQAEAEALMANDRMVMDTNRVMTFDEVITTADGVTTLSSTKGPLRDRDGGVVGIFGISRDITERKRAEEALRKNEAYIKAIMENLPIGIAVNSVDPAVTFQYLNDNFTRYYRTTRDALATRDSFWTAVYEEPEFREEIRKRVLDDCASGNPAQMHWIDVPITRRGKETTYIEAMNTPLPDQRLMISSVWDVTERKRAEEALRESREKMGLILNSTAEGIYGLDQAGNCTFCNAAGVRLLGYRSEQDLLGKNIHGLLHHTRADGTAYPNNQCLAVKVLSGGECVHSDKEVLWRADGSSFLAEYWAHPIQREGGTIGAVVTFIDITEHRKLEDQLRQAQKMEAIGQLAGGVAHDFNNILSAIIGYGHLTLMKMQDTDPSRNFIEQILQSSERATALTQSLLAFSRKQVVKKELIKLNSVIGNFEKFLARLLREDIELRTQYADEELTILADRGQIEQVIMNLVTNARDAMPAKGALTIETGRMVLDESFLSAHGYGRPGEYAMLSVSDTGLGMDKETRRKIFEPFFTTKEQGKGTGLGLATVYGIVKSHDGFINVYSEPGTGTLFHIYLPLVRAAAGAPDPVTQAPPQLTGGTETILLAEDDASLRKMTSTVLKHMGYTVIEAENGREAVEKFIENRNSIRLVILDGIMPEMNGKDAYKEIFAHDPGARCIFMSGYAEEVFTRDGVLQTDVEFIAKPATPSALLNKVRDVLDR